MVAVADLHPDPADVLAAVTELHVDRIDHGYRVVDDPAILAAVKDFAVPFTCTPRSTAMLSGWAFTPQHRIAQMIRAGLPVTFATDDAVFFKTDIGLEYRQAIPAFDLDHSDAARIARAHSTSGSMRANVGTPEPNARSSFAASPSTPRLSMAEWNAPNSISRRTVPR